MATPGGRLSLVFHYAVISPAAAHQRAAHLLPEAVVSFAPFCPLTLLIGLWRAALEPIRGKPDSKDTVRQTRLKALVVVVSTDWFVMDQPNY